MEEEVDALLNFFLNDFLHRQNDYCEDHFIEFLVIFLPDVDAVDQLRGQPPELHEELPLREEAVIPGKIATYKLFLYNQFFHLTDNQIIFLAILGFWLDDGNDKGVFDVYRERVFFERILDDFTFRA